MLLDAQTLGFAVATVTGAGYALLMSKKLKIKFNQGGSPPVTFFRKALRHNFFNPDSAGTRLGNAGKA